MNNLINKRFLIVLLIDFFISAIAINLSGFIRLGNFYAVNSYETLIAAIVFLGSNNLNLWIPPVLIVVKPTVLIPEI